MGVMGFPLLFLLYESLNLWFSFKVAGPLRGVDYMVIILIQFPHSLLRASQSRLNQCSILKFSKTSKSLWKWNITSKSAELKLWHPRTYLNKQPPRGKSWATPTSLVRGSLRPYKKRPNFWGGECWTTMIVGPQKIEVYYTIHGSFKYV